LFDGLGILVFNRFQKQYPLRGENRWVGKKPLTKRFEIPVFLRVQQDLALRKSPFMFPWLKAAVDAAARFVVSI
jgi:hypothetical protein